MTKVRVLQVFIFNLLFLFLVRNASSEQVHTFNLEQNSVALKFKVSLPKDSFDLLETIVFEVSVKNISKQPFVGPAIKSPWWIIKNENGITYNYPSPLIPLDLGTLRPGASTNKSFFLEAVQYGENNLDVPIYYQYFPEGRYKVYYGPDTIPFTFNLLVNPNSKNHFRRKKFVEFYYTQGPVTGFF